MHPTSSMHITSNPGLFVISFCLSTIWLDPSPSCPATQLLGWPTSVSDYSIDNLPPASASYLAQAVPSNILGNSCHGSMWGHTSSSRGICIPLCLRSVWYNSCCDTFAWKCSCHCVGLCDQQFFGKTAISNLLCYGIESQRYDCVPEEIALHGNVDLILAAS